MADVTFEQIKGLIEQMPSTDVDRLRDWLNESMETVAKTSHDSTWGEKLVALVNQFDLDESDLGDTTDPEAWVREHRRTKSQRRNPDWGEE